MSLSRRDPLPSLSPIARRALQDYVNCTDKAWHRFLAATKEFVARELTPDEVETVRYAFESDLSIAQAVGIIEGRRPVAVI